MEPDPRRPLRRSHRLLERTGPTGAAAIGGVLGAAARWAVGRIVATASGDPSGKGVSVAELDGFPWATVIVNVLGCLLIGVAARRLVRGTLAWTLLVTGVLGGFTTMSAFAVESNALAEAGRPGLVAATLVATLAGGLGALLIGERAAASSMQRPSTTGRPR